MRDMYNTRIPELLVAAIKNADAQEVRIFMKGDHSITSIEIG